MGLFNRSKTSGDQVGIFNKMTQTVAETLRSIFKVRWSYVARRASQAYLELFHTSPRLNAVDIIATDCANTQFKLYKKSDLRLNKDTAKPIGDHPMYDLLENPIPNRPDIDGFTLRYMTNVYIEILGDCYWVVVKDIRGQPRELYVVPTTWVISTPSESQPYFLIQPFGNTSSQAINVAPEDVIWWKTPDMTLPYGRGRGRTERIGDEIETDEYAKKWQKNLFWNDATPQGIITAPGANDTQLKVLNDAWNQAHRGISNTKKTGFFGFDAKYIPMSTSPRELDFIESNKMLRDACNQHFQIPPEILGILEQSNRSTIDASFFLYSKNVITKRNLRFDAVITRQLLPMFDNTLACVSDNVVPEDEEFALKVATDSFNAGLITRGEARQMIGQPLLGNDYDNEILIPFSVTAENVTKKRVEPTPVAATPTEPKKPDTTTPATEPVGEPAGQPLKSKGLTGDQRIKAWQQFDKTASKNEEPFKKGMKKIADTQQKEFDNVFTDKIGAGMKIDEALDFAVKTVFDDEADIQTKNALYKGWVQSMKSGLDIANGHGVDVSFDKVQPKFKAWIEEFGLDKAKSINETTKEDLKASLAEGIDAGESIRELQGRIVDQFDGVRDYRSERIARTESVQAVNNGSFVSYKEGGLEFKEWLTTMDGREREAHAEADGQIVPIDEPFVVDGEELMYPGDPTGSPENTINERCTILPNFKGSD